MNENFDIFVSNIKKRNENLEEQILKPYATFSHDAIRYYEDYGSETIRPEFCRDADRIIHSLSFSRFSDKTQVFFWIESDVFQHRLIHVQLVAKIGRFISKILGLNEDLAEAIALGHDIGHCPFGHDGERILSSLCNRNNIGNFKHNYESVWFLQNVEMQNLTLQSYDGLLSHNGEVHERKLKPDLNALSWNKLEEEMEKLIHKNKNDKWNPKPKTMEGTLIRYVDTISYISRDVRDAESLNLASFSDLPSNVKNALGSSNRSIINALINDLIENSIDNDYISYSSEICNALIELYEFNLEHIYLNKRKLNASKILESAFEKLWYKFLIDIENDNRDSEIFKDHFDYNLMDIETRYPNVTNYKTYPYFKYILTNPNVVVRDFIAGMTDSYFLRLLNKYFPEIKFKKEII